MCIDDQIADTQREEAKRNQAESKEAKHEEYDCKEAEGKEAEATTQQSPFERPRLTSLMLGRTLRDCVYRDHVRGKERIKSVSVGPPQQEANVKEIDDWQRI